MRRQTERLMNLLIALRAARGWTDRDDLRRSISDYADLDDAAFDRQFSRDKAALEAMGIAISTTSWDDPFTDGTGYGYRIDDADYALTRIDFTPAEAAVVSVTQSLLADTALAADARSALNKLRGLGEGFASPPDARRADVPGTVVPAHVAGTAFAGLLRAVEARRAVAFDYRRPGAEPTRRTLEPYALLTRGDRTYVVGRDVDRDAIRTFRLSRIQGRLRNAPRRRDGDYTVPDDFVASEYVRRDSTPLPADGASPDGRREDRAHPHGSVSAHQPVDVAIAVAPGRALPLRDSAHDSCPPVAAESPHVPHGWDVLALRIADHTAFAERLLDFSPSVVVLEPASLVRAHVDLLTRTAHSLDRLMTTADQSAAGRPAGRPAAEEGDD
ncbi:hypothetical protein GCM10023159_05730 [Brevibacterium yomogidense]